MPVYDNTVTLLGYEFIHVFAVLLSPQLVRRTVAHEHATKLGGGTEAYLHSFITLILGGGE